MPFWKCSDPFVNALKSAGYNMVRLPKADIEPMQMFYKKGSSLERLGSVTKLLNTGDNIPVPTMSKDTQAANISGKRSGKLKIGFGISLLGTVIGAMGGTSLGLETEYKNAKTATFEFSDVKEDKIDIIDLDQYLSDADINPASRYVSKLLEADKLYITTAVIKSKKITFEAISSSGTEVGVDVPAIQGVVGGKVKVGTEGSSETKLTYEGDTPLIFGFQAIKLYYENGSYTGIKPTSGVTMKSIEDMKAVYKDGINDGGGEKFISEDTFVHFDDLS